MKKIFKICLFVLIISVAILGAAVFLSPSSNLICRAATSDNTHTVNFYSGKDLLYSVEVKDGQSLQDLEDTNLLYNSDFTDCTIGNYTASFSSTYLGSNSYWSIYGNSSLTAEVDLYNFLLVNNSSTSTTYYLNYRGNNLLSYSGQIITMSCSYKSLSGDVYFWLETQPTSSGISKRLDVNSNFVSNSGSIPSNSTKCGFTFSIAKNSSVILDYVKLELGDTATDYFKTSYITKLYKQFNNLSSNANVLWSTLNSTGQFDFSQPITEDTNIYGYEELEFNNNAQELEAEVSYQPSYYLLEKAIDNIEYIHYKGSLFFNVIVDTNKFSGNLATYGLNFFDINSTILLSDFTAATSTTQTKNFNSISISNTGKVLAQDYSDLPLNLAVYGVEGQSNVVKITYYLNMGNSLYQFKVNPNVGKVCLSFTTSAISYDNGFVYNDYEFYDFYNGTKINDMNSNTNYFLQFSSLSPNFLDNYQALIDIYQGNKNYLSFNYDYSLFNNSNYLTITTQGQTNDTDKITSVQDDGIIGNQMYIDFANTYLNYEFGFKFSQFDVIVRKPVARVDNSLVIFNFGYNNFLSAVTQTKYELRRGYQYYDVIYNGRLENSKMIVIDNEYVRNSLFDEYIFLSFISDGSVTSTVDILDGKIGTYLGFDFNFVYYTQPLIAGNSAYDLMEYRPQYMDATPSLVPFVLPVTAWIYNAFLWLVFDCPLISDLLGLIHLNRFLGALMSILNIYISSAIGQFILACLSFVIFWAILKSLMPALVGTGKSIYSNTQFAYNRRRKKQDKFNIRNQIKEEKYQQKLQNKRDKARRKVN